MWPSPHDLRPRPTADAWSLEQAFVGGFGHVYWSLLRQYPTEAEARRGLASMYRGMAPEEAPPMLRLRQPLGPLPERLERPSGRVLVTVEGDPVVWPGVFP